MSDELKEILKEIRELRREITRAFPLYLNYPQTAISVATATKPADPSVIAKGGAAGYDSVLVFEQMHRLSPKCWLINDGLEGVGTLYAVSTSDGISWSGESEILVHEARAFLNVHELRVRSPTLLSYRVTEYEPVFLA